MVVRMTYPEHVKAILVLGLPLIGGHIGQIAIHMTDTLMLGWYSVEALAAVVLASSLFFVLFIVGSGFAWAVMPMVAAAAEESDDAQIRRVTRMGMWLAVLFGLLVLPLMWWSGPIFIAMSQEPELSYEAQRYLRIAGVGVLPALGVMILKSYLAALERTGIVLWITLIGALTNAALNYALIFGNFGAPELGIQGAAIASVSVNMVSLAILVPYGKRAFPEHALFQRIWRPDWAAFGKVFQLGWPIGLTNLAESGLFAASAIMMGWLGTYPLAAHGIALQIASATFMVHMGLSNAATVRAGRALGRKDLDHLARGGIASIALSVLFSVVTVVLFLVIPETLIGAFIDPFDPDRPQIVAVGVTLLAVAAAFQLVDGLQVMALGLLRGVQDARVPMILASISYWVVGLPASYLLGFTLGLDGVGVWIGLVIGLALASVALVWRFWGVSLPRLTANGGTRVEF